MAANVLTGVVKITAPGVEQTFEKVGKGLQNVSKTSSSATQSLVNFGRVVQDAPYGIIGIANNLNPLFEGFGRLQKETGSAGAAFKALGKDLVGAGGISLAISLVSSALIVFGDAIFGAGEKTKGFNFELNALSQQAKDSKDRLQELGSQLDNLQKSATIVFNIQNSDETARTLAKGDFAVGTLVEKLNASKLAADEAGKRYNKAFELFQAGASKSAQSAAAVFNVARDIPDELIDKYKGKDKELLKAIKEGNQNLIDAQKNYNKVSDELNIARLQRTFDNKEQEKKNAEKAAQDEKDRLAKQKADYEKWVSEMITKGKELSNALKTFAVVPEFTIFDTKNEQLQKALKIIKQFNTAALEFKAPVSIDLKDKPEVFKGEARDLGFLFGKEMAEYFQTGFQQTTDFSLIDAATIDKAAKSYGDIFGSVFIRAAFKTLKAGGGMTKALVDGADAANAAKALADSFNSAFSEAISGSFESIGEGIGNILSGNDFGKQFASVFSSLFTQIGKALIKFGIVKTGIDKILANFEIPGAVAIGLGLFAIAAGKLVQNLSGGRAAGGPVQAGKSYIVGEFGPERFTPNTGGNIQSANSLSSGRSMVGGVMIQVTGEFGLRGKDLKAAIVLADQSNARLV